MHSQEDAWSVDEEAFCEGGPRREQLRFLVAYAVLAPSSHNSQPWTFALAEDHLDLRADRTRSLPIVDPDDRALTISCGAALYNLRLAARAFALRANMEVLPSPDDRDLLARVRLEPSSPPSAEERAAFEAIPRRHTNRVAYDPTPPPEEVTRALVDAARAEGADLVWLDDDARASVTPLVAEGDRAQMADPAFRRELAAWIHPNRSHSRDGMPGSAHGQSDLTSVLGPLVIRTFDLGKSQAAKDEDLLRRSPVLGVFTTAEDSPEAWLQTGQALQRSLLLATAHGLSASYLNQPVEVASLRARLAALLGGGQVPQLLVRFGVAPPTSPTPRRPADEVIVQVS